METLGQKQRRFSKDAAHLVLEIYARGFECSLGEAKRSDEQAEINALGFAGRSALCAFISKRFPLLAAAIGNNGHADGIRRSLHQQQLAIDLNLFKDGIYLTDSVDYLPFGLWWEARGVDYRWGGRFTSPDGNHFSVEHLGVK